VCPVLCVCRGFKVAITQEFSPFSLCKSVIRSARREYIPHDANRIMICSLFFFSLHSYIDPRWMIITDASMWSWIFADIPPYPFSRFLLNGAKSPTRQFPFHFYNDKIYVKRTVLGALKNIHTTMYKECQKENCYQVFPFLHISLFLLFFLILSMCSVMYDFIFLA